jgi:hypothetical protein
MTLKEALSTKATSLSLSAAEVELALFEAKMDGNGQYDPDTQAQQLDMVYAGLLLTAIHVTEVREDDVSIKRSGDMKGIYSAIMRRWELTDPFAIAKPSVKQKFVW